MINGITITPTIYTSGNIIFAKNVAAIFSKITKITTSINGIIIINTGFSFFLFLNNSIICSMYL